MERHTKHRILGVLVVIGLVVIMLPFFQTKNELPSETALVKTPPFPDQAVDTSKNDAAPANQISAVSSEPADTIESAEAAEPADAISTSPIPLTVTTAPLVTPVPDSNAVPKAQEASAAKQEETKNVSPDVKQDVASNEPVAKFDPENMTEAKQEIAKNDAAPELAANNAPAEPVTEKVKEVSDVQPAALPEGSERDMADMYDKPVNAEPVQHVKVAKAVKPAKSAHNKVASKHKAKKHVVDGYQVLEPGEVASASKNKFAKLKSGNWAVQLGSFKIKSNAVRLVNLLRSRGYHSFMEEASSNKSGLTRVLVGPELKKDHAHTLASKLENEVHIRGMVINYKPLAL